jgi:hypothetical protein
MFHPLTYDGTCRTYLASFSGTLTEQDLADCREALQECLLRHGPVAGLQDFSEVTRCELTASLTVSRGLAPQLMTGQKRVIVAEGLVFGMMRMYAAYQSTHNVEPIVVRSFSEAYEELGFVAGDFHPVALAANIPGVVA